MLLLSDFTSHITVPTYLCLNRQMSTAQLQQYNETVQTEKCFWLTVHTRQETKDQDWVWPKYFNHCRWQNSLNKVNHNILRPSTDFCLCSAKALKRLNTFFIQNEVPWTSLCNAAGRLRFQITCSTNHDR